ncbi:MAG: selenium metabolism-associated LysR family transcriptional regulator [Fastidiosipilaceae bacterium]|mgnify:CR=1 FL=1|nr:LysR family transcriptional regulator [Clostridiaceae bacterium]
MDYKQLEIFVAVVENMSFSQAAVELNVSQPTVSTQIKMLEEELNVPLFIRSTRDLKLTEDSLYLYSKAKDMLAQRQHVLDYFLQSKRQTIRLGVSTIPAGYVLPVLISQIRRVMPTIVIKGIESNSRGIIEKVREHMIDVGIVGLKLQTDDCEFIPIYRDEIVFITPNTPYYSDLKNQYGSFSNLIKEPMIIRESGSGVKKNMDLIIQEMGATKEDLNVVASINDIEVVKKLVISGVGTSFVSLIAVSEELRKKQLIAIPLKGVEHRYRYLYVVWNKNVTQPVHIKDFTAHLLEIAKRDFN